VQAALAADGQPVLRIDGSTPAKRRGQARQTRACRSHHAGPAVRACRWRCMCSACAGGAWQWLTMSRRLCHPRPRLCAPGAARVCEPRAWRPGGAAAQPQGGRRGPQPDRRVARALAGAVLEPCQCARASAAARSALLAGAGRRHGPRVRRHWSCWRSQLSRPRHWHVHPLFCWRWGALAPCWWRLWRVAAASVLGPCRRAALWRLQE